MITGALDTCKAVLWNFISAIIVRNWCDSYSLVLSQHVQSYALGGLTPFATRAVIIGFQYLHVHAKKTSNVIALRYCFVEESMHEICHDNVSGRNCKLSLCKMLVLLRVDFSSGRGSGEGQIAKGSRLFGLNGDVRLNEACFWNKLTQAR